MRNKLLSLAITATAVTVSLFSSVNADTGMKQGCRVTNNGVTTLQSCVPVGDVGYYQTTRGDLKTMYCTKAVFPVATGCTFVN